MSSHNNLPDYLYGEHPLAKEVYDTPEWARPLVREVVKEIFDPTLSKFQHGRRHGYNQGCRGPLCMKALRDDQRRRTRERAERKGLSTRPYQRSDALIRTDNQISRINGAYELYWPNRMTYTHDPIRIAEAIRQVLSEWDAGIPRSAVLVHRLRDPAPDNDGYPKRSYLMTGVNAGIAWHF